MVLEGEYVFIWYSGSVALSAYLYSLFLILLLVFQQQTARLPLNPGPSVERAEKTPGSLFSDSHLFGFIVQSM